MPSIFATDPEIKLGIDSRDDALYSLSALPRHMPQHIATSRRRVGGYISHFYVSQHLSIIFSLYEIISPHCNFYSNIGHVASCMYARDYLYINLSPHEAVHMKQP
jgi:hypothetical protein